MEVHGANCYISSTEPGRFEVIKYSPEEIRDAWQVFKGSAGYGDPLKGYDPRKTSD